ncbi:unnamed protein product [Thelazia callipaeda]|uniref:Armadillo segment polarity protein n=1 Tax=Thelazia callipaeda TaxID=103827 RepID=A0A158RC61_THECL|nr:unnamed protein product [Thelazia callipaeda]
MENGETLRQNYTPSPLFGTDSEMNHCYAKFKELDESYAQTRSDRVRMAMFPNLCSEKTCMASLHRSTILSKLTEPSQLLTTAVIELISLQDETELTTKAIPELIKLLADKDETVIMRAVHMVHLLSRENKSVNAIASNPTLVNSLCNATRCENDAIRRDALGALLHISEHAEGRMHIFRSGGIPELVAMIGIPVDAVRHYAITTLHNLLLFMDYAKEETRACSGLEAMTPLLHENNPRFLALLADSLYLLLLDSPQSKLSFLSLSGPSLLIDLLDTNRHHPKVVYTAVRCIRAISVCPQNKAALVSLGTLNVLGDFISNVDERTQSAVLCAIRNLSDAAANEDSLGPLIISLIQLISAGEESATACAAGILSNLTCNNIRNKQTLCLHRGMDALCAALERFSLVEEVTEPTLCALRHCTARHPLASQAQSDIRLSQTLPVILTLISSMRTPVVKAALGLIRNLALLPANLYSLTHQKTPKDESVVTLTMDVLGRAGSQLRQDPDALADGVAMRELVEGAISALHQLGNDLQSAELMLRDHSFIDMLVKLLSWEEIYVNEDELLQRELLGLLYQLSKTPEGARQLEMYGVTPVLCATYASGVLKNLQFDKPLLYRGELDTEIESVLNSGEEWMHDGLEPELFAELYHSSELEQLDHPQPWQHPPPYQTNNRRERILKFIRSQALNGMVDIEVHECDLFEHEPFVVDCLALDERQGILCVARHSDYNKQKRNGMIEFWNVIGTPIFHVRNTFLGNKTVESLLWLDDVLLAAHIDGSITGHCLHTSEYFTARFTPSSLWCLASISGLSFCAGSDSGAVLLLSLEENNRIVLNKTISIGFGVHVMSLACNNDVVAAGTVDEISLISISKQRIEHTIKLPRIEKRKPTIVWCLCFIGKLLASGDSRGYVTFWNASNGAFSHCLQTHQADVLCMAVANESIYAAGVDPTIARLGLNQDCAVYRVEHRKLIHSNDVRALVASQHTPFIYSGGADYYFSVSDRSKHAYGLKNIMCSIAPQTNLFSYQYDDHIVIWKAGSPRTKMLNKRIYCLEDDPVKLGYLRSHQGKSIVSSALNYKGTLLAVSTIGTTTLYKFDFEFSKEPSISLLKRWDIIGTKLLFSSTYLFIASLSFKISFISLSDLLPEHPLTIAKRDGAGEVVQLNGNMDETLLVILTTRNELFILNIKEKMLRKLDILGSHVIIDAQFVSDISLYILCADMKNTIIEYNTRSNSLSENTVSTEALCMLQNEVVLQMNCSLEGIILGGSRGSLRIITLVNGERVLLYGPEACALKRTAEGEGAGVCLIRRDRCVQACWLSSRKLLFTTPIMYAEPSQTAFRLKRYGLN